MDLGLAHKTILITGGAKGIGASSQSSHTTGQLIFLDGGYTHFDRVVGHDHDKWQ